MDAKDKFIIIMCIIVFIMRCVIGGFILQNKKQIQPGDFVYCQRKDDVVGDYWIGRVEYVGERDITIKGGVVPFLADSYSEYGLHQPFVGPLDTLNKVECYKIKFIH